MCQQNGQQIKNSQRGATIREVITTATNFLRTVLRAWNSLASSGIGWQQRGSRCSTRYARIRGLTAIAMCQPNGRTILNLAGGAHAKERCGVIRNFLQSASDVLKDLALYGNPSTLLGNKCLRNSSPTSRLMATVMYHLNGKIILNFRVGATTSAQIASERYSPWTASSV